MYIQLRIACVALPLPLALISSPGCRDGRTAIPRCLFTLLVVPRSSRARGSLETVARSNQTLPEFLDAYKEFAGASLLRPFRAHAVLPHGSFHGLTWHMA